MKRLLNTFACAAVTGTLLSSSAVAHAQVQIIIGPPVLERIEAPRQVGDGYVPMRTQRASHVHAPSARDSRDGTDVAPRRWVDRNHDGMDDRRGRRDLDRDGIQDQHDRDLDNDGIANRHDNDIDGDGVRNHRDRRPDNPHAC